MRSIRADSTEYLQVTITADQDIGADVVDLSVDGGATWLTAETVTSTGTTLTVRVLVGPGAGIPLTPGTSTVLVRIHDSPETPVIPAGVLVVLA